MKNKGLFALTLLPLLTFFGYSNFSFASTSSGTGSTGTGKISTGTTSVVKISPKLVKTITIDDKKYKIYKSGTNYYIVKPSGLKSPKNFTSLVGVMNYAKTAFKKKVLLTNTGTTTQKIVEIPKKIITSTGTTKSTTTSTSQTVTPTTTPTTNTTNNYDSSTRAS